MLLSGLALARDDDDYYRRGGYDQARQYGYQNGYRDGLKKGNHEGRERDPLDYQTPDWRKATHGYKNWMGSVDIYRRGYQEGYSAGFRNGYQEIAGPRYGFRDSYGREYYDAGNYGRNNSVRNIGYQFGYGDGSTVAREDIEKRKPYNPNPRGKYDDRDHGYRREFGNKDEYKAQYTAGYIAGYEAVMRRY